MALLSSTALTMADWAKRQDDEGKTAAIVELLSQLNEILDDMLIVEGNLPTGHKTTVRTGLPTASWRLLNYGVQKSKSTTAQVINSCGNLKAFSDINKDLADLNGNTAEFRLSETRAFLEAMSQQMAQTLIYGNLAVNPERFQGLSPRYNTVNIATAQTAANVINMGGTGSNQHQPLDRLLGQRHRAWDLPQGQDHRAAAQRHGRMAGHRCQRRALHGVPGPLQVGTRVQPARLALCRAALQHQRDAAQLGQCRQPDQRHRPRPAAAADRRHPLQPGDDERCAYDLRADGPGRDLRQPGGQHLPQPASHEQVERAAQHDAVRTASR